MIVPASLVPASSAAADTCHGREATVVPAMGTLVGTPGPDVIVSHGEFFDAGDGDDLVCLVGEARYVDDSTGGDAGPGNDVVDASQTGRVVRVRLGPGAHTYLGAPGYDEVYAATLDYGYVDPSERDVDTDVIDAGEGDNSIHSGYPGVANTDRITGGRGDDWMELHGLDHATSFDLGGGFNTLVTQLTSSHPTSWRFDAPAHEWSSDGVTSSWGGSIGRYWLTGPYSPGATDPSTLELVGTPAAEEVRILSSAIPTLRMAGGNDRVEVQSLPDIGSTGSFLLGRGRDRLVLETLDRADLSYETKLRVDLGRGRIAYGDRYADGTVRGVEVLRASATDLEVVGSARADVVQADGCDVAVSGRGGDDLLVRIGGDLRGCGGRATTLLGGPGGDRLRGSSTWDVLIGGGGRDRAYGGAGRDTCRAEVERGCER